MRYTGLGVRLVSGIPACAKLNLHLSVGGVQPDGYHRLVSVVQQVGFADWVELDAFPASAIDVDLHVVGQLDCPTRDNLAFRAARLFLAKGGLKAKICLRLRKRIPAGAGLGGGSSDAAAVLRLLNQHYRAFNKQQLTQLALQLGADVPVFLAEGAFIVSGRGEHLHPLPNRSGLSYLIVVPTGWFCSTPLLFKLLDQQRGSTFRGHHPCTDALEQRWLGDPQQWSFHNDFTEVVSTLYPRLPAYLAYLRQCGARAAGVSGSGAALWAVFDSIGACRQGQERLTADYDCWSTVTQAVFEPSLK